MIDFNINDEVWLKLTDKGREIHRAAVPPDLLKFVETDANGWTRFQLWEAMRIFGKHLCNGCSLAFETTIRIETKPVEKTLNPGNMNI